MLTKVFGLTCPLSARVSRVGIALPCAHHFCCCYPKNLLALTPGSAGGGFSLVSTPVTPGQDQLPELSGSQAGSSLGRS